MKKQLTYYKSNIKIKNLSWYKGLRDDENNKVIYLERNMFGKGITFYI